MLVWVPAQQAKVQDNMCVDVCKLDKNMSAWKVNVQSPCLVCLRAAVLLGVMFSLGWIWKVGGWFAGWDRSCH